MGMSNYTNLLKQKSRKFFTDISDSNKPDVINKNKKGFSEKIQLKVSITEINEDCSYKVHLFNIIDNEKNVINEYVDCKSEDGITTNLNFPIIMTYFFETEQPLIVEIERINSDYSNKFEIKTELAYIMGSRKKTLEKKISDTEKEILIMQAEKVIQNEDIINVKFKISSCRIINYKEIKNKMYYEIFSEKKILYRSECLNDQGLFKPVKIPIILFKDNNILVIIYKSNRKKRGIFNLNIEEFTNGKSHIFIRVNGTYFEIVSKSKLTKNYTFVDYLNSGVQIGLSIAIDFSISNGNPKEKKSLHYINGEEPNQYERAINSCGNIVAYYDYDQLFPCFGFGAKYDNKFYPLFNLNFKDNPDIHFIRGILDAYHNALIKVELYGPTFFGPIIKNINQSIKNANNKLKYYILMILTDGIIEDIGDTIEELVEGSFLPLSVIIIGVGNADFSGMNILDADENPLINSKGIMAARDLVHFVPFLKFENNSDKLANEVLAEIPRQIVEYYELNNLVPVNLVT